LLILISESEHVANTASSKTESNASTHPLHQQEPPKGDKVEFIYSSGTPGPAESDKLAGIQQEGTKEEREARTKELNK
jgi:hypothetical protein